VRKMTSWQQITGINFGYILELYDRYREDPNSVDESTRIFFDQWGPPDVSQLARGEFTAAQIDLKKAVGAANLAQAIRSYGHLAAQLDPLGSQPSGDPSLSPAFHGVAEDDLRSFPADLVGGPVAQSTANALDTIQALRDIYCTTIGYDYDHIHEPTERDWLRDAAESRRFRSQRGKFDPLKLLERLTQVEVFEHFLHRIFPGKTRFSIEGLDMLVPMLDEIVGAAAESEICMIFLGMAHRGRLNILAHVLQKPYAQILAEFKDPRGSSTTWDKLGWTGDVKYHKGAQRAVEEDEVVELVINMPSNPSHLEHINPVLEGMARAADTRVDQPGDPLFYPKASLPVLIHGDASFPGQGVMAETLNFSRLEGYQTAGTIHIIANNQLGYTAEAQETRGSRYASDLAKGFEIPVIHVNADDPEACLEAARIAFEFREQFQEDFLIDLIGYRRYGHNEGDEPSFTQPLMYATIENHPTVRDIWARALVKQGVISEELPEELVRKGMDALQQVNDSLEPEQALVEPHPESPPPGAARQVKTAVTVARMQELNEALLKFPEDFNIHPKMSRTIKRRRQIFENKNEANVDWATAEELAFATILQDRIAIRLTGEDVIRGTFSQRHAVFYDVDAAGKTFTPLKEIPQAKASFEIYNSPLSENAAIGFEFGYNVQATDRLVIWEAQYGDFVNVAQIMLDEFLTSARAKWGQTPSMVLLLPHGNEGQGPDHSSGRPERFLGLASETNMRIAIPTSAAQFFHLLRRQALLLKTDPLPLIVFTPKGLLRHPLISSHPEEFSKGTWRSVLDDPLHDQIAKKVRRLLLCSGRVYIDLVTSNLREANKDVAIARVEQLYPFPLDELKGILESYPKLEQVVWVQEEPQNMGAWDFLRPRLVELSTGLSLHYVGRPPSSSPAEGSSYWYKTTQEVLVDRAYSYSEEQDIVESSVIASNE
jgi:2-oxoglutarate dehydrogenase E1 component